MINNINDLELFLIRNNFKYTICDVKDGICPVELDNGKNDDFYMIYVNDVNSCITNVIIEIESPMLEKTEVKSEEELLAIILKYNNLAKS